MDKSLIIKNNELLKYTDNNELSNITKPLTKEIFLDDVFVDLLSDYIPIQANLKSGDQINLKRITESSNDETIEVRTTDGTLLGDVDEYKSTIFAHLMDAGKELKATVKALATSLDRSVLELSICMIDY